MLILTLRKVHTGLQYIWNPDCPALPTSIPMAVPPQTKIFFPSYDATLLSGATIQYHYKDHSRLSVVSTAVYSLAIWTRGSRHSSSPGSFLLTAAQISKQWKCTKITLDLSAERQEEGSVASRPSYSKYILLSNHNFSDCLPWKIQEGSCGGIVCS